MNAELGLLSVFIKTLGAPGLIVICMGAPSLVMGFMYADHRRYERERLAAAKIDGDKQAELIRDRAKTEADHKADIARIDAQFMAIITQQEKRFEVVVKNYENNVILVESHQKLSNELATIIHMNTQVMTKLVEKIDNNHYCPMAKEGVRG
jgi:hypothetical protein